MKTLLYVLVAIIVLVWGVGDLVLTYVGGHGVMDNESNPLATTVLGLGGWKAVIAVKLAGLALLGLFIGYAYKRSVKFGLFVAGTGVVFSLLLLAVNLAVITGVIQV